MAKMSIEWHKNCLKNMREYQVRLKEEFKRAESNLKRISSDVSFLECQIQEAENQGKDGFDADRFLGGRTRK